MSSRIASFASSVGADGAEHGVLAIDLADVFAVREYRVPERRSGIRESHRDVTMLLARTPGHIFLVDAPYAEVERLWSASREVVRVEAPKRILPGPGAAGMN